MKAIQSDTRTLIRDMFETMYGAHGVGLAAVQVAKDVRVLVVDAGKVVGETRESHPLCMINPEIVKQEGKIWYEEGCLSCPNLQIPVERAAQIELRGLNEKGEPLVIEASDLLAIALQHEIDHLEGKLLVDRISRLKREIYRRDLAKSEKP